MDSSMAGGSLSGRTRSLGAEPSCLHHVIGDGSDSGGDRLEGEKELVSSAVVKKEQRSLGRNSSPERTGGRR